jgi:hypothetical protein
MRYSRGNPEPCLCGDPDCKRCHPNFCPHQTAEEMAEDEAVAEDKEDEKRRARRDPGRSAGT